MCSAMRHRERALDLEYLPTMPMNRYETITADECLASGVTSHVSGEQTLSSASPAECKVSTVSTWCGHSPIAHEVLLSILLRAAVGDQDFTREERILYTACEFWAAIHARSIVTHLGSKARDNLRDAAVAFSSIGATHVASLLDAVHRDRASAPKTERLLHGLAILENELPYTLDLVDHLIASYATGMKQSSRSPA
jgi:hypothetical protein